MQNSAFGSIKVADNLTELACGNFLVTDVEQAAQIVPFRFPERDFRDTDAYDWQFEKKIAMSVLVMRKFQQWYEHSKPVERTALAVIALTDTSHFIDHIIEEATEELLKAHQVLMIDHDESHCYVTDYKAATDPFKISNALNSVVLSHWIELFEAQVRRIINAPPMSLEHVKFWTQRQDVHRRQIEYKIRQNPYWHYGFTIKNGRKFLHRSYNYFASFFGQKAAHDFIRGIPLQIRGHYFTWELELEPSNFIHNTLNPPRGHVPYYLRLRDHKGQLLADGCVCFDYCVLDQAVILGMWVATPEGELNLIRMTNFTNLTPRGIEHDNGIILGFPNVTVPVQLGPMNPLDTAAIREAARGMTGAQRLRFYDELHARRLADAEVLRQDDDPPWDAGARVCRIDEMAHEVEILEVEDWVDSEDSEESGEPMTVEAYWDHEIERCLYAYQRVRMERTADQDREAAPLFRAIAHADNVGNRAALMDIAVEAQRGMRLGLAQIKRRREMNPINRALREELYRRIDAPPDLLAYMADPEIPWFELKRFWHAPRLERFISRKEPLGS